MNNINAESTIVSIMEHLDPGSAAKFRSTEKRIKIIMDSDEYWGSCPSKVPLGFESLNKPMYKTHISSGISRIVMESSFKTMTCISCGNHTSNSTHPFHGTVVCRRCTETNPLYRMMGERAACKKYKIGLEKLGDTPRIRKSHGVYRVLEHQVKKKAEELFGKDTVSSRLEKSYKRSRVIHNNRLNSYNKRLGLLKFKTKSLIMRSKVRVDPSFQEIDFIIRLAGIHMISYFIINDVLDFKVTSRFSIDNASERLFDFACLLTYCRRMGVFMDDYITKCPYHDDVNIGDIFRDHCSGGIHFYEYMVSYITSIDRLIQRSKDVLIYTGSRKHEMDRYDRMDTYIILCMEEGIDYDDEISCSNELCEYINHGVGDPVMIARESRKIQFLCENGYDDILEYYLSYGICYCISSSRARAGALLRCGSFPIMNRVCIDDRIPMIPFSSW